MITAEEFRLSKLIQSNHKWSEEEIMIEFTKLHVVEALKEASKKTPIHVDIDSGRSKKPLYQPLTLENDILNAYPLTKIK